MHMEGMKCRVLYGRASHDCVLRQLLYRRFPLHLPTLKRQQFFGAVANSLGKNSYFPLQLDVRRCVAPTGEEVDARQRGVNKCMRNGLLEAWLATLRQNLLPFL